MLRELTDEDAEDYMSRPEMKAFLAEANCPPTMEQALEVIWYCGNLFRNKRSFYWGIALKNTDQLIGTAGFNIISPQNLRAKISYDLMLYLGLKITVFIVTSAMIRILFNN